MDALRVRRGSTYVSFDDVSRRLQRTPPRSRRARAIPRALFGRVRRRLQARGDPRHNIPNPYRSHRESLACWKRVTAPVLLVTGGIPTSRWLKDPLRSSRSAKRIPRLQGSELEARPHDASDQPAAAGFYRGFSGGVVSLPGEPSLRSLRRALVGQPSRARGRRPASGRMRFARDGARALVPIKNQRIQRVTIRSNSPHTLPVSRSPYPSRSALPST